MCIWKVAEEDRQCGYCSYRGGCECHARVVPIEEMRDIYVSILSGIIGRDILVKSREHMLVWARNMVCYRLVADGYSLSRVGKAVGVDHSTVLHARRQVENMLEMPCMYREEIKIWQKFTNLLSLTQN